MLVDMQRAFQAVAGDLALEKQLTARLKHRQDFVSAEFKALL